MCSFSPTTVELVIPQMRQVLGVAVAVGNGPGNVVDNLRVFVFLVLETASLVVFRFSPT